MAQVPDTAAGAPDETRRLIAQAQAGDAAAREELVRANLRLVAAVAQRFRTSGVDLDDLFQVGCIGLIKAIDGFDPAYEVRFSTYAVPVIMGEMRQYLRRQRSPLHLGARLASLQREVAACEERLAARLERQPTVGEIASELNVDAEEVAAAVAARAVASLDEPLYPDDGDAVSLGDRLAGGEDWERLVENVALHAALARLSEWERRLVVLRFFEDKSQDETARALGVSQAHVSRSERRILQFFRETLGSAS